MLLHMSLVAALIDVAQLSKVASEKGRTPSVLWGIIFQNGSRIVAVLQRSNDAAVRESLSPGEMTRAALWSFLHSWLLGRHSRGSTGVTRLHDLMSHHGPKWIPYNGEELMYVSFTKYTH